MPVSTAIDLSDASSVDPPAPTDAEVVATTRPTDVLRLQEEYTRKLQEVTRQLRLIAAEQEADNPMVRLVTTNPLTKTSPAQLKYLESVRNATELWNLCNKLRPAATDLARYASGLVEGVRLDKLTKIELRMRNAELEATIENAAEAAKLPTRSRG